MIINTLWGGEELLDTKRCSECGKEYPKTNQYFGIASGGNYFRGTCKLCGIKNNRITKKLKEQYPTPINHVCPICKRNDEENRGEGNLWKNKSVFVLDHDHDTGKFRGWPCQYCNIMIGNANEDTRVLERAIDYLNNSKDL